MARHEADREDLLAEATALVRRAELDLGGPDPATAGFRRDGGLSVYLGPDPAYHFDSAGRLKRAYRSGRLYRTQGETLAELTRERTPAETILVRRDLPEPERDAFLAEAVGRLATLLLFLENGTAVVRRQVPEGDAAFLPDLAAALRRIARTAPADLLAPRYKGKR